MQGSWRMLGSWKKLGSLECSRQIVDRQDVDCDSDVFDLGFYIANRWIVGSSVGRLFEDRG